MKTDALKNDFIPDLLLERFLLEELSAEEMKSVREKIKSNPEYQTRLEELKKSNTGILEQYPIDEMAREIYRKADTGIDEEKIRKPELSRWQLIWRSVAIAAPVMAAMLMMFIVFSPRSSDELLSPLEETRIKGDTRLIIQRMRDGHIDFLHDYAIAKEGDIIQISYFSENAKHGVILSIDGNLKVILHYPEYRGRPTEIQTMEVVPLSFAYQLDDAPHFERFIFITSDRPIDVDMVLERARAVTYSLENAGEARLQLPGYLNQYSIFVHKEN
jgi:hypothetical protein